jgi:hypothetical protein
MHHSAQRTTAHLLYEGLHNFHGVIRKMRCHELCALWVAPSAEHYLIEHFKFRDLIAGFGHIHKLGDSTREMAHG